MKIRFAGKIIVTAPGCQQKNPDQPVKRVEIQGGLKLFEDPVVAEAIVDRLIHPSQKITLKGEKSYREKLAEKKTGLKNQGGS
ncbi:MAG TPA: ATP-binding protein, partial [Candidatus Binatia bacterium]